MGVHTTVKKLLALGMIAALILSAAGCGAKTEDDPTSTAEPQSTVSEMSADPFDDPETTETLPGNSEGDTTSADPAGSTTTAGGTVKTTTVKIKDRSDVNVDVSMSEKAESIYDGISGEIRVPIFAEPDDLRLALKAGFEKKYPKCTVKFEVYGWNEWQTSIINMVASKKPTDLAPMFAHSQFIQYAAKKIVQPLDDYVDLADKNWDKNITEGFVWSGKHYGMGGYAVGNCLFMYYNKTMLDKAGLDPLKEYNKGNWTWDTFRSFASQMNVDTDKNGTYDQIGLATPYWEAFTWVNGGGGVKLNSNGTVSITLGDQRELDGMDFIRKLYNEDKAYQWLEWDTLWSAGKVAFTINRAWNAVGTFDLYNKGGFTVGMVPIPKQNAQTKAYLPMFLEAHGVPTGAKNPKAAMAFLNYWVNFDKENEKTPLGLENRRKTMSDEHLAFADAYAAKTPTSFSYIDSVGDWYNKRWALWGALFDDNKTAKAAVESARGVLQNEINRTLK